jgi:uncharacterized protein
MKSSGIYLAIFILFRCGALPGQSFTPESVPNEKLKNNGYISDPAKILDETSFARINSTLSFLEDSVGNEIALVLLPSIGDLIPKDFAHDLFNLWGIGKKGADNGLLILFVLDQRRVEFETGNGLEAVLPDAICKRIVTNELIPSFKQQAYGEGLIKGVEAIARILQNPENVIQYEEKADTGDSFSFLSGYGIVTAFINGLIMLLLGRSSRRNETPYKKYHTFKKYHIVALAFIFPIPYILILWYVRKQMNLLRNTPPPEDHGVVLRKADGPAASSFLNSGQAKEVALGVSEYDVWVGEGVSPTILRYLKAPKSYTVCGVCKYQTEKLSGSTILRAATYSYSGEMLLRYACLHCGNTRESIRIIPKKIRSSSGSSGSGRSGGGSWGGGRSSGGGAGGSW